MKTLTILTAAALIGLASCKNDEFHCVKCRTIYPAAYHMYTGEIIDTVFCGQSVEFIDQYIKDNSAVIHYQKDTGVFVYTITTECH